MDRVAAAKWGIVALLGGGILFAGWKWSEWRAAAEAGSAYAARITCSCRYVAGRSAESCAMDIKEDASPVFISEEPEDKAITGSVPLLGSATARFRPGYGCVMEPGPAPAAR